MDTPKTEPVQRKQKSEHTNTPESSRVQTASSLSASAAVAQHDGSSMDEAVSVAGSGFKSKPDVGNNIRKLRMERMMSKAELARRAGLSTLTIDRVEKGMACRMDTKRKILEALGLTPSDRIDVFGEDD